MLPLFCSFLVWPSSQNLGTLSYWSSWFQQYLFLWHIRCQQDLDWITSCPGKESSPYQVGHGLPPAQSLKKSALLVFLAINGTFTSVYYENYKHILCCSHRVCRFSLQTCFALMVCIESNPAVLSRGETCRHKCFDPVCIQTNVSIRCVYRGKLGFQVSKDCWILQSFL